MTQPPSSRDRLQPALLDRLLAPKDGATPALSKRQLREGVLRDLRWLLNAVQPHPDWAREKPELAGTVLNFGIPVLTGKQASSVTLAQLELDIGNAIKRFEPRILPHSLEVKAFEPEDVLGTHNVIEFEIKGLLWALPVPLEVLYRTRLDLEAGLVNVKDVHLGDAQLAPEPGLAP
ncbi:type VI secretion system baseplate subunit TssE [Roseateles sp. NT4]|uniref:type VI secretion system baseplate subunit TssE n=1 Tax=Roseateles sp. NT4 TaxID=3453715 RepID=UPI003EE862D9